MGYYNDKAEALFLMKFTGLTLAVGAGIKLGVHDTGKLMRLRG